MYSLWPPFRSRLDKQKFWINLLTVLLKPHCSLPKCWYAEKLGNLKKTKGPFLGPVWSIYHNDWENKKSNKNLYPPPPLLTSYHYVFLSFLERRFYSRILTQSGNVKFEKHFYNTAFQNQFMDTVKNVVRIADISGSFYFIKYWAPYLSQENRNLIWEIT